MVLLSCAAGCSFQSQGTATQHNDATSAVDGNVSADAGATIDGNANADASATIDGSLIDAILPVDSRVIPDAAPDANPCPGLSFKPSNVSDCSAVAGDSTDLHLTNGFYTFDTDLETLTPAPPDNGSIGTLSVVTQNNGVDILFVALGSLEIDSLATVHVTGSRALAVIVSGDVTIGGTINGGAAGTTAGPGSSSTVCTQTGSGGRGADGPQDAVPPSLHGYGGGGGGSFGGAVGGAGGAVFQGVNGVFATAGAVDGNDNNVPLRGGCGGGDGGGNSSSTGGGGGGALQLYAGGDMIINGAITMAGGGGSTGSSNSAGGGGGGSGGAILLEGNTVTINSSAFITANGGGGGEGDRASLGANGGDGHPKDSTPAVGGHTNGSHGGNGGNGAAGSTAATAGSEGNQTGPTAAGGGGGGGGVGRIFLRTPSGSPLLVGTPLISPMAL